VKKYIEVFCSDLILSKIYLFTKKLSDVRILFLVIIGMISVENALFFNKIIAYRPVSVFTFCE